MSSTKERYQNPSVGDTVNLRIYAYNNNNFSDFQGVEKVEIYYLDPEERSEENPQGRRLVDTVDGDLVTHDETGHYSLALDLETEKYVIGTYLDVWYLQVREGETSEPVVHPFEVYPDRWFTTPVPVVYDFDFHFRPNRFRLGSKQYIRIEIVPSVPTGTDLAKYYENLAISADLSITIEQRCGDCVPQEQDLRTIVDEEPVTLREKRFAFYQFDTTDLDCGIYDVTFKMEFAGNTYVSDRMQLQVYN